MTTHSADGTPLERLARTGQSVWIDRLSRDLLRSGGLRRLLAEHAITGVTTNPTILEQAIGDGAGYDEQILDLMNFGLPAELIAMELSANDVTEAALQLLPIWESTAGADGYVSWEVDPSLAWHSGATLSAVERAHRRIDLPNLLVKIPATEEGLQALEDAVAVGRSINVTLIFSLERYAAVVEAYLRGLRRAADAGLDLSLIHSVASFFISRLDVAADELLTQDGSDEALALRGQLGIASAKLAHRHFQAAFSSSRWEALRSCGARPQRPLWASTSTKNPAYRDVRYVEELIGADTVTTLPKSTLEAFEDHGQIEQTLTHDVERAAATIGDLASVGIDLGRLTSDLERDGIERFARSRDALIARVEAHHRRRAA